MITKFDARNCIIIVVSTSKNNNLQKVKATVVKAMDQWWVNITLPISIQHKLSIFMTKNIGDIDILYCSALWRLTY